MRAVKLCTKCKTLKSATDFHKHPSTVDRLDKRCKSCASAAKKVAYVANGEHTRLKQKEYREAKPHVAKAREARWRKNNPDKSRAKSRRYYHSNRDKELARMLAWKCSNVALSKKLYKQWRARNKPLLAHYAAKYRAKRTGATPAWANKDKIVEFYFAADFLGMVTGEWYHVDHIVPLQSKRVCGLHCEQNLQVLEGVENMRKGNRHWPDM